MGVVKKNKETNGTGSHGGHGGLLKEPVGTVDLKAAGGRPFTVIRGVTYDLTDFIERHPGGAHMIRQAIGRDGTSLFESYHIRTEKVDAVLAKLTKLDPITVPVDEGPFPNDSPLYRRLRERLRKEVLRGRSQRGGINHLIYIDLAVAVCAYSLYVYSNSWVYGLLMGLVGAHLGMTLNHCANHGALSENSTVNFWLGFTNDFIGGSSLVWSYHHHVSHHLYVNSIHRDQDVYAAMPFIRFDKRLPKAWFHIYQHVYMGLLFPMLFAQKHVSDLKALIKGKTKAVQMIGATSTDYTLALVAKALHLLLLLVVPLYIHGSSFWLSYLTFAAVGSSTLAWLFAISHNLDEAKTDPDIPNDWAATQICHSANYGGWFEGLLTGGLNLQIEHHLFPALAYTHYPALVPIVQEECRKAGVRYNQYGNVFSMVKHFVDFMRVVGDS